MPRKTSDSSEARIAAEALLDKHEVEQADRAVSAFAAAELETATSKVGGAEIQLRRVLLTGPWEVVQG